MMSFNWDDIKAATNKKKHGVSFAEAATVFNDPNALEMFDKDYSDSEERWVLVGLSAKTRVLLVVFAEISDYSIRIISARKAEKEEIDQYYTKVNQ